MALLVVNILDAVKTTRSFIALAKKRPGEIIYGSPVASRLLHLAMALLNSMTGTKMIHVPYKAACPVNIAIRVRKIRRWLRPIASVIPNIKRSECSPFA